MGINIKGITIPALLITLDKKLNFEENLKELEKKLSSAFFEHSISIIDTNNIKINEKQRKKLENLLKSYNSQLIGFKHEEPRKSKIFSLGESKSLKIINKTLRSGQRVEHNGDVLILGDVNPDAYVIASGNIIIMGTLRGIVHAGANGNENAEVIALKLKPQQLRIAGYYTRSPDEENEEEPEYPERAYIEGNRIYIEKI